MKELPADPPYSDEPQVNRQLAHRIASRCCGAAPCLRWIRSDEVDVCIVASEERPWLPKKVIKLDRPGSHVAAQQQRLLPYLRGAGVEVPEIEQCGLEPVADVRGAVVAYSVQPFLERRGIGTIYVENPARARDVAARLGRSVARLHGLRPDEVPGGSTAEEIRYWLSRSLVSRHCMYRDTFALRSGPFDRACMKAERLLARLPTHFGNGQGYQSLFDGHGAFAIIDWGTCGVYWRMYDLAQAVGAMDVWCRWEAPPDGAVVTKDTIAADLVPRLLGAYLDEWGSDLSGVEPDELALWRVHDALISAMKAQVRGREASALMHMAIVDQVPRERLGAIM